MGALIGFAIGVFFGTSAGVLATAMVVAAHKGDEQGKMLDDDYESCVLCGKRTGIPKMMPVSERAYYIEGSGQLCPECYRKLYGGQRNG